jgi:hypothetical protein
MEYITASCVIERQTVYRNGAVVFKPKAPNAADLLKMVYRNFDWQYPKFYKMDLLSRLGWAAAELLLGDGWDPTVYRSEDVAVVLSNANSSLDTDLRYQATIPDIPSPSVFVYTLPNIMIGEICIRHQFKGENAFFVFPSFNAGFLVDYVSHLLEQGFARACITGWVELLRQECKAALYLVERTEKAGSPVFSPENMRSIFQTSIV